MPGRARRLRCDGNKVHSAFWIRRPGLRSVHNGAALHPDARGLMGRPATGRASSLLCRRPHYQQSKEASNRAPGPPTHLSRLGRQYERGPAYASCSGLALCRPRPILQPSGSTRLPRQNFQCPGMQVCQGVIAAHHNLLFICGSVLLGPGLQCGNLPSGLQRAAEMICSQGRVAQGGGQ